MLALVIAFLSSCCCLSGLLLPSGFLNPIPSKPRGCYARWAAVWPSACGVPARAIKLGARVTLDRRSFVCAHQSLPAKVKRSSRFLSPPAVVQLRRGTACISREREFRKATVPVASPL